MKTLMPSICVLAIAAATPVAAQDPDPAVPAPATPSADQAKMEAETKEAIKIFEKKAVNPSVFTFDYGVPASPALTLLGVATDQIAQSNTLKPFVLSIPKLFGGEGGDAIAFDFAPAAILISPSKRTWRAYQDNREIRLLARSRLAVAAFEGEEDSEDPAGNRASRVTAGFSVSLLDTSDPLRAKWPGQSTPAWTVCTLPILDKIAQSAKPIVAELGYTAVFSKQRVLSEKKKSLDPVTDAAQIAEINRQITELETKLNKSQENVQNKLRDEFAQTQESKDLLGCKQRADLAARIGADWDVGGGVVWQGSARRFDDLETSSAVVWTSYRRTIGVQTREGEIRTAKVDDVTGWWMIGLSGRAGWNELVATGDSATPEITANTLDIWAGVEHYSESNRFALQVGHQWRDARDPGNASFDESRTRVALSAAQRLGGKDSATWLNVAYGHAFGGGSMPDDDRVMVSFTFAPPDPSKIFGGL